MGNNEYIVNFSYNDYKRLYDYNKNKIYKIIDEKWPNYAPNIKKILFGSIYKGFFDHTSSNLKNKYGLDYKSLLDALLVKHLNTIFERVISTIEKSNFIIERNSDLDVFGEFAGYIASCCREEFKIDSSNRKHITPFSYLKKISLKEIDKKEMIYKTLIDYENLKDKVEEEYNSCIYSDLSSDEKDKIKDESKNIISWFLKNKFGDDKFSGIAVSKFYRGFFGDKAEAVINKLKKYNIKVPNNSLNFVMNTEMRDMFVVMHNVLRKEILSTDYVNSKYVNEIGLLSDAYLIGAVAKDIYTSYYNLEPFEALVFNNSDELKQVTNVKPSKKVRKKKIKTIEFKNDEGEQLFIDSSFDVSNRRER